MAIRLIEEYPNRVGAPTADYPHGVPRNKSTPTATDGTPFEQSWFRDQEGFFQGLMETAGITPSGAPDTVLNSDYLDALNRVTNGVIEVDMGGAADVSLSAYQGRVAALKLTGALAADVDLIVPDTERLYWIIDETTGDFSVTVKTAAGTGVVVSQGQTFVVRCDGTDVVRGVDSQRTIYVGSVSEMTAWPLSALSGGEQFSVSGYYDGAIRGGGVFTWDAAATATSNGGTVFEADSGGTGRFLRNRQLFIDAHDFGGGATKTPAENKTIIETIIDLCVGDLYGSTVLVPNECEYGYKFDDPTTYLEKTNTDAFCVVEDYTPGADTNAGGLPTWGSQYRRWMFAEGEVAQNEENTGIGNTAGNSTLIHGLWNPGMVMQVNGENIDNRRVRIFWGARGENFWSIGQGNNSIPYEPGTTAEDNGSNEKRRRHFAIAGKTNDISAYQNKYVIRQDNGHHGWNLQEPEFTYHFVNNPSVVGTLTAVFENRDDEATQLTLKNASNQFDFRLDSAGRVLVYNQAGEVVCQIRESGEIRVTGGINGGAFTTSERNALIGTLAIGTMVFDTDLNKPVWFDSPGVWRDATGASV